MQAPEPDVQTIRLHKSNNGMGLSIVAAKVSDKEEVIRYFTYCFFNLMNSIECFTLFAFVSF